jgi:hypothetical protein
MEEQRPEEERRILEADRLYRSGLTLREVGLQLRPPVTAQRVTQLLRHGLLLHLIDELPQHRRRSAKDLDEGTVREAALRFGDRRRVAEHLRANLPSLEARFGNVLRDALSARRAQRRENTRQRIIADYLALAERLGHYPSSSEAGPNLARRIWKSFRTFEAFWRAAGVRPQYRRAPLRDRAIQHEAPPDGPSL